MSKFTIPDQTLYICTGSKCSKRGGKDTYKAAKSFLKRQPPVCAFQPGNNWLHEYKEKDVLKLLSTMMMHD